MATYRVELGSFAKAVEPSILNEWRALNPDSIDVFTDSNGTKTYWTGSFESPRDANQRYRELELLGLNPVGYFPIKNGNVKIFGWQGEIPLGELTETLTSLAPSA